MVTPRQRKVFPLVPGLKIPTHSAAQGLQDFQQCDDSYDETSLDNLSDNTSMDSHFTANTVSKQSSMDGIMVTAPPESLSGLTSPCTVQY